MRSLTRQAPLFVLCLLALMLVAAGCGGAAPASPTVAAATATTDPALGSVQTTSTAPAAPGTTTDGAYPAAGAVAEAYPAEGAVVAEAYPPPSAEETFLEPRFRIDQPVTASTTTITGQAPPNLTLGIFDVTYNGAPLGSGQSDANGAFAIPVSGLVAGNRIGLAISELPAGMDMTQTAETYFPYRGEGFQNLPNVGVFYDTVLVE